MSNDRINGSGPLLVMLDFYQDIVVNQVEVLSVVFTGHGVHADAAKGMLPYRIPSF